MAFTTSTLHLGELFTRPETKEVAISVLATSAAAGIASLSALGGPVAVARGIVGFLEAYRQERDGGGHALSALSANYAVVVGVSSTSALLTIQIPIKVAA